MDKYVLVVVGLTLVGVQGLFMAQLHLSPQIVEKNNIQL